MARWTALLMALVVLVAATPGAEAKKHRRVSHVPACAAMPGAPCQALIRNWRPSVTRLVVLKEMMK